MLSWKQADYKRRSRVFIMRCKVAKFEAKWFLQKTCFDT